MSVPATSYRQSLSADYPQQEKTKDEKVTKPPESGPPEPHRKEELPLIEDTEEEVARILVALKEGSDVTTSLLELQALLETRGRKIPLPGRVFEEIFDFVKSGEIRNYPTELQLSLLISLRLSCLWTLRGRKEPYTQKNVGVFLKGLRSFPISHKEDLVHYRLQFEKKLSEELILLLQSKDDLLNSAIKQCMMIFATKTVRIARLEISALVQGGFMLIKLASEVKKKLPNKWSYQFFMHLGAVDQICDLALNPDATPQQLDLITQGFDPTLPGKPTWFERQGLITLYSRLLFNLPSLPQISDFRQQVFEKLTSFAFSPKQENRIKLTAASTFVGFLTSGSQDLQRWTKEYLEKDETANQLVLSLEKDDDPCAFFEIEREVETETLELVQQMKGVKSKGIDRQIAKITQLLDFCGEKLETPGKITGHLFVIFENGDALRNHPLETRISLARLLRKSLTYTQQKRAAPYSVSEVNRYRQTLEIPVPPINGGKTLEEQQALELQFELDWARDLVLVLPTDRKNLILLVKLMDSLLLKGDDEPMDLLLEAQASLQNRWGLQLVAFENLSQDLLQNTGQTRPRFQFLHTLFSYAQYSKTSWHQIYGAARIIHKLLDKLPPIPELRDFRKELFDAFVSPAPMRIKNFVEKKLERWLHTGPLDLLSWINQTDFSDKAKRLVEKNDPSLQDLERSMVFIRIDTNLLIESYQRQALEAKNQGNPQLAVRFSLLAVISEQYQQHELLALYSSPEHQLEESYRHLLLFLGLKLVQGSEKEQQLLLRQLSPVFSAGSNLPSNERFLFFHYLFVRASQSQDMFLALLRETAPDYYRENFGSWLETLHTLFSPSQQPSLWIEDGLQGTLSTQLAPHFNNEMRLRKPDGQRGRRAVLHFGACHLKEEPEFPGTEYMVRSLYSLLFGQPKEPLSLVRISRPEKKQSIPILATRTVQGPSLEELLTEHPDGPPIKPLSFSRQVVSTFLTYQEDGKPDNFICVLDEQTGEYELHCIDNDHAFVNPIERQSVLDKLRPSVRNESYQVNHKCVLYCFDEIQKPIHEEVRIALMQDPEELLSTWLLDLVLEHQKQTSLFTQSEIATFYKNLKNNQEKEACLIGCFMDSTWVQHIFETLLRLQVLVSKNPEITHFELLHILNPLVASAYAKASAEKSSIVERFRFVENGQYNQANLSQLNSQYRAESLLGKVSQFTQEREKYTPKRAIQEFSILKAQYCKLLELQKATQTGNGVLVGTLLKEILTDKTPNGTGLDALKTNFFVEIILEYLDFTALNVSEAVQRLIINQLKTLRPKALSFRQEPLYHIEHLKLKGCTALTDSDLSTLIRLFPNLTYIDLRGCSQITNKGLQELYSCKKLEKLLLNETRIQSLDNRRTVPFLAPYWPALRFLSIANCPELTNVTVTNSPIQRLLANNNPSLEKIDIESEALQRCNLRSCPALKRVLLFTPKELELYCQGSENWLPLVNFYNPILVRIPSESKQQDEELAPAEALVRQLLSENRYTIERSGIQELIKLLGTDVQNQILSNDPALTNLDIQKTKLSSQAWIALAYALRLNNKIQTAAFSEDPPPIFFDLLSPNPIANFFKSAFGTLSPESDQSIGFTFHSNDKPVATIKRWDVPGLPAQMEVLRRSENRPLLDFSNLHFSNLSLDLVFQYFPNISGMILNGYKNFVDNEFLNDLAPKHPGLRRLEIEGCLEVTDQGIINLVKTCSELEDLNLNDCYQITDQTLEILAAHCKNLQTLSLSNCRSITDRGIEVLSKHCGNLQTLSLSNCRSITDRGIEVLSKHCGNLQTLSLSGCHNITDTGIESLADNCKDLQTLDLSSCVWISDKGVEALAKQCKNLQTLHFFHSNVTDRGLEILAKHCIHLHTLTFIWCEKITGKGIEVVAKQCNYLKTLDLTGCKSITDQTVETLANHCKHLQTLKLYNSDQITNKGIISLAGQCKNLHTLGLHFCDKITDKGIETLAKQCSNLINLDLSRCNLITDQGLGVFASHCKKLKTLIIKLCYRITDKGIISLANHCKNLRILDLRACGKITDNGIVELSNQCKVLEDLTLNCDDRITDKGIRAIASNCKQLQKLDLSWTRKISDTALEFLAAQCQNLRVLRLSGGDTVADKTIGGLVTHGYNLQILNLSDCKITNKGIRTIANHCKNLEVFYLTMNSNITDEAVEILTMKCKHLQTLDLTGCQNITKTALQALISQNARLRILHLSGIKDMTDEVIDATRIAMPHLTIIK